MNSVMYSPYEHNMAFACCGQKVLFKKPFNCSHTTFLTSYKSHIFNLSQSKFQRHIIYQVNYKFKFTNSNTNFVMFLVCYQKLLLYTTTSCLLWLSLFQFIILFICNPSISNPGPNSSCQFKTSTDLSIFHQNVQGLIPFSNLAQDHTQLDNNKIFELNAYNNKHNHDIIILNETWLKPSILDNEIFPPDK